MDTRKQLAEALLTVNLADVASLADVSTRTVSRLRNLQTVPSVETAARLFDAVEKLRAPAGKGKRPARMAAKKVPA